MENILTLGKLLSLWFCFLLHSISFLISQTSYWRASEASETLSGLFNRESQIYILLASERSEQDTLISVQSRIADIYIIYYIYI